VIVSLTADVTRHRIDDLLLRANSQAIGGQRIDPHRYKRTRQWYRRKSAGEAADHVPSAQGELLVYAGKGSEEAALYDDLVNREIGANTPRSGEPFVDY